MQNRNGTMNQWRKKSKRGVSPIIATILLVAITVVLAAVLYILISGLTKGPGSTPIGSALAVGTVNEASAGSNFYYNMTVQTASGGMTWSNMIFQVQSAAGGVIGAGPTTITTTNAAASCNVGTYTFATALWSTPGTHCATGSTGGSGLVVNGAAIQLVSSVSLQSQGDKLVAVGQGSFAGSAVFSIP